MISTICTSAKVLQGGREYWYSSPFLEILLVICQVQLSSGILNISTDVYHDIPRFLEGLKHDGAMTFPCKGISN